MTEDKAQLAVLKAWVEERLQAEREALHRMPDRNYGRGYTRGVVRTLEEFEERLA